MEIRKWGSLEPGGGIEDSFGNHHKGDHALPEQGVESHEVELVLQNASQGYLSKSLHKILPATLGGQLDLVYITTDLGVGKRQRGNPVPDVGTFYYGVF